MLILRMVGLLRDTACSCSKIHATPRTNRAELDLCDGDVRARAWLHAVWMPS